MELDKPPPSEAATASSALPTHQKATAAAAALSSSTDPDPIVASYAVVTNPAPTASSARKLLILQHPNKQGPLRVPYPTLAEVRVKPSAGMIEVDVPLSYHDGTAYDRDKGMRWGQALSRSMQQKNGGSHGLAGGFGVGVPAPRAGRRAAKDGEESITYDWTEAVRRDQVLRTQTLGGQYAGRNAESDEECRWMIGVFKGGE
jgi:DNA-directed RNA polymerase III subunit RPC5